jgi:hypothetical protein
MQTQDFTRAYEAFAAKQKPAVRRGLSMTPRTAHLALPFFDDAHRDLAPAWRLGAAAVWWTNATTARPAASGCAGWVKPAGCATACRPRIGGALERLDSRALVILRETLAFHSPLADFAFAMQGLGSGAITLAGTPAQQARYLPAGGARRGRSRPLRSASPMPVRTWRDDSGSPAPSRHF